MQCDLHLPPRGDFDPLDGLRHRRMCIRLQSAVSVARDLGIRMVGENKQAHCERFDLPVQPEIDPALVP